jgi:protein TonB
LVIVIGMNSRLLWFILISLIFHILLITLVKFDKDQEEKKEPINIEIIEKKPPVTPAPVRPVTPAPQPDPIIPVPDDSKTKMTPQESVTTKPSETTKSGTLDEKKSKSPVKGETPPAKEPQREPRRPELPKKPVLPGMDFPDRLPSASIDKDIRDRILNPTDIINRTAKEGGQDEEGEESVSMQQVKSRYTSYFYKFRRQLYQTWTYPKPAGMRGEQGTVRIKFAIHKNGNITDIQVVRSSGYPDLDNEAVRALKSMGGVPLPDSYELNVLRVDGYFIYYLGGAIDIY